MAYRLKKAALYLWLAILSFTMPLAKAQSWTVSWAGNHFPYHGPFTNYDYAWGGASYRCSDGEYEWYPPTVVWLAHFYFMCWVIGARGSAETVASVGAAGADAAASITTEDYSSFWLDWGYWSCEPGSYASEAYIEAWNC